MARRRQEEEEHADETWLVPYSDVLTLLLALFIVLFAVSKVDAEKFKQLSESFQAVFQGSTGVLPGERSFIPSVTPPPASAPQTMDISQPENIMSDAEINDALNAFIDAHNLQEVVAIRATSSGFSIRVLDSVAFSSGSDHLQPGSEPLLDQIAEIASKSAD